LIQAGDSDSNQGRDTGPPSVGRGPNSFARSREVTIPGYNHIDVTTAARRQNDGRPEPSSTALTDFLLDVIPVKPRIRLTVRPRRVRAGRRVRIRFRVRSSVRGCRRGVRIRFAGRRVRTRRNGRASIRFRRLGRTGRRRVIARKRGCRTGTARVRVLRKRRARRR
jgi:hypothetical protein